MEAAAIPSEIFNKEEGGIVEELIFQKSRLGSRFISVNAIKIPGRPAGRPASSIANVLDIAIPVIHTNRILPNWSTIFTNVASSFRARERFA